MILLFIDDFVRWIVRQIGRFGYAGIIILMGLESSFVPFPSEVVIPPAGYLSSTAGGEQMILWLVIAAGIAGSVIGALFNYALAYFFGRKVLVVIGLGLRKIPLIGRFIGFNEDKVIKWEGFFKKHGEISTFIGRLIPGIRQYISFPAGLARMNLLKFTAYTGLGAGIWVVILAYIGYFVGKNEELIKENSHLASLFLLLLVIIVVACYIFFHRRAKRRSKLMQPAEKAVDVETR